MSSINDTDKATKWRKSDQSTLSTVAANIAFIQKVDPLRGLIIGQSDYFRFIGQPERIKEDLTPEWEPAAETLRKVERKIEALLNGEKLVDWKKHLHGKKKA